MTGKHTSLVAISSLLLATGSLSAATVIFSGEDYADGLISTQGTLVGALNAGRANATTTSINGVDFVGYQGGAGLIFLSGTATYLHSGGDTIGANGAGGLGTLTNSGVFNTAGTDGSLYFGGLTAGQDYEVQFIFSDTRENLTPDSMRIWGTTTPTGPSFTTADIMTAQLVTASFTADPGGGQGFYVTQDTGVGSFDGYLGAAQIRAVPEPSSAAILGLGGLAFLVRRRR